MLGKTSHTHSHTLNNAQKTEQEAEESLFSTDSQKIKFPFAESIPLSSPSTLKAHAFIAHKRGNMAFPIHSV